MKQPIFALLFLILMSSCGVLQTQRNKNISYLSATAEMPEKTLNVFAPKKAKNAPVLIFIHGGSWHSGRKEIYDFMGNRLAAKGVVSVIIDYPLAPTYQLPAMEKASARAVQWVKENIASYANFYIANEVVVVPTFRDKNDQKALDILSTCFPTRRVVGIDSTDIIWGLGSFHCLSQQEPAVTF